MTQRQLTIQALKELSMIFLVMVEREKKVRDSLNIIQIDIRKEVLLGIKGFNPYDLYKTIS